MKFDPYETFAGIPGFQVEFSKLMELDEAWEAASSLERAVL